MMHVYKLHYNHDSGVVTGEVAGDVKETVAEHCTGLRLTAGDDVAVRVDAGMTHIESLTREPLIVRPRKGSQELEVLTTVKPANDPVTK